MDTIAMDGFLVWIVDSSDQSMTCNIRSSHFKPVNVCKNGYLKR